MKRRRNKMAKLINDALALQSFRHSDFDVYSAYGEVIDNSLQADATWVKIKIDSSPKTSYGKNPYYVINEVVFCDNGSGMNNIILSNCLAMGYSSRYGDRKGIGRFGVGMTLASINQCKKVDVYSREKKGKWLWTYTDLDEIASGKTTEIPDAIEKKPPEKYKDLLPEDSGTIVVWSKYDRQPETATNIEKELHIWLGRTYRYFIWDNVEIYVNDKKVYAIDPLFVKTEKTQFPDNPKAQELESINFKWSTMKELDDDPNLPLEAPITIRMSFLPEEFRPKRFSGGSEEAEKFYIDRNNGISIVRNKREVFYGEIPYFKARFEEMDRWWGGEISFNAVLDKAFTVKNIKRGAVPTHDLREEIQKLIKPTRDQVKKDVADLWKKKDSEERSHGAENNEHEEAELIVKKTPTPANVIDKNKKPEHEVPKIAERFGSDENEIEKLKTKLLSDILTIQEKDWIGLNFFDTEHYGGKSFLAYNKTHPFFEELNRIMDKITIEYPNSQLHRDLKTLIDLLLASYSKSEAMLPTEKPMRVEDCIENIKGDWGKYLTQFIRTWNEQKNDDDKGDTLF
jgi:hypothetical protein